MFSSKLHEMLYYTKQLERISLISSVFSLIQLCAGISCIFDFSFAQDSMGLGVNSIILNIGLIAV